MGRAGRELPWGVCVPGAVRLGDVPSSAGACASTRPAMEHKHQMVNNFQLTSAFALCKYLERKAHNGFQNRQTPNPTAPGSTQVHFSCPFFSQRTALVTQQGDFYVYQNLCNGSELTVHLLMLRLEAANETASLSQAPANTNAGVRRAAEIPSKRGTCCWRGWAHNNGHRCPSPAGHRLKKAPCINK